MLKVASSAFTITFDSKGFDKTTLVTCRGSEDPESLRHSPVWFGSYVHKEIVKITTKKWWMAEAKKGFVS